LNFSALSAELAQSFPAELAENSAQKVENSTEVAGIPLKQREFPLKKRNNPLKAAKSAASRFPAPAALFCSKSRKKLLCYAEVKLRVAGFLLHWHYN
jgi:hypothetical protein